MKKTNYEITTKTCALKGKNKNQFLLIEDKKISTVNMKLSKFLNYNCTYFGSSYEGRIKSSQLLLGMKYKLPIVVEESREIIFFPTKSKENITCEWISLNNIKTFEEKNFSTVVTFKNGLKMTFDISLESFENQFLRASKLQLLLKNRKIN